MARPILTCGTGPFHWLTKQSEPAGYSHSPSAYHHNATRGKRSRHGYPI